MLDTPQPEALRISDFYKPFPPQPGRDYSPQERFHSSPARFRLQVGGFGSGKSLAMIWEAVFHCLEYPGANALIIRKTIPDLKRTVIDKFLACIPKNLYQTYNHTDHIVYFWPDPKTGAQSKLYLSACERDADVGKFLSTEYVFIGFEELGEFSFAVWDALEGRNRCPVPGSRPCMVGTTNPMGVGWSWIKKLWIDGQCDHKVKRGHFCEACGGKAIVDMSKVVALLGIDAEKFNTEDYEYIHSTVDDNPVYANNKEYIATLEKSPNRDRIRWGKLDAMSGLYFENWDPTRHMRFKEEFIFQPWQPVWVGWDYGFGHYAYINFMTKALFRDPVRQVVRTVNVTMRELVLHKNTPKEQAEALILAIPRLPEEQGGGYAWQVEQIHFSWERFIKTTGDFTVADEVSGILQAAGLPAVTRSNTDRIAGWQKMFDLLDTDEWFILADCPVLCESLPLLQRGNGVNCSVEDVVKPKGISLADDVGDGCLVAGTLIDTVRGLVPIEQVRAGDYVLTRKGYRRVLWSGQTGVKPVMRLDSLTLTPNHPVLSNGQFVIASDILSPCLFTRKKSYLRALPTDAIRTQSMHTSESTTVDGRTDGTLSYTSRFTAAITARFRKAMKFITRIIIPSTMSPITWWRSQAQRTSERIGLRGNALTAEGLSFLPPIGTIPTADTVRRDAGDSVFLANNAGSDSCRTDKEPNNGSAPTLASRHGDAPQGLTMWQKFVSSAASLSPAIATLLLGFARKDVLTSARHGALLSARPVFNLSVEGEEEYFANGILVHNCRYAIAGSLLDEADKPKDLKFREELARIKDPMARHVRAMREYYAEQKKMRQGPKPPSLPTWAAKLRGKPQ